MQSSENPYQTWGQSVAAAQPNVRAEFIRRTYLHLTGAVLAFAGLEAALLNTPGIENLVGLMFGGRWSWFIVLGAFMGVSYLANSWAQSNTSRSMQYLGLGLYVVAEAVIFLPLLFLAGRISPTIIPSAGVLTVLLFGGLTAVVFISKADFSFLRTGLSIAGFAALGICLCSALFGFHLGILFVGCMIALASGYILYETSGVMRQYGADQHVAAALALFASVAMLFWYFVQLLSMLNSRD
jgi:FtsH-binding integral membrane protein